MAALTNEFFEICLFESCICIVFIKLFPFQMNWKEMFFIFAMATMASYACLYFKFVRHIALFTWNAWKSESESVHYLFTVNDWKAAIFMFTFNFFYCLQWKCLLLYVLFISIHDQFVLLCDFVLSVFLVFFITLKIFERFFQELYRI